VLNGVIQKRIAELQKKLSERLEIKQDDVVKELESDILFPLTLYWHVLELDTVKIQRTRTPQE